MIPLYLCLRGSAQQANAEATLLSLIVLYTVCGHKASAKKIFTFRAPHALQSNPSDKHSVR